MTEIRWSFVTVAAEMCGFLERVSQLKRRDFVDKALKLLPLLYLKVSLLPECERIDEFSVPETFVTEVDYPAASQFYRSAFGRKG